MTEYNVFLDEWKAIRTTQETILKRLDGQEQKNNKTATKKLIWLSVGVLMAVLVVGILIGAIINTHAQIKSIPYAVSSESGCKAMGGNWDIQKNNKFCYFVGR